MKLKPLAILLMISIFLTGCAGSKPSTHIKVNMTDFAYNPNVYYVPAGREITVDIANNGVVVHNFIIMKSGSEIGQDFDAEDEKNVFWRIEVSPGQSASATFTAPGEPGDYLIVCSTAGHYIAGMIGKLVAVPANE